jgi:truncated hemoglobin YjbI
MRAALDDIAMPEEADQVIWSYLVNAADVLVNTE